MNITRDLSQLQNPFAGAIALFDAFGSRFRNNKSAQLNAVIRESLAEFDNRYPKSKESLFDEWFLLNTVRGLLTLHAKGEINLTSQILAVAYANHLGGSAELRKANAEKSIGMTTSFLQIFNSILG